jgi:GDP-4-dehydro-6-deoxy-D-mannose reductase
MPPGVTLITGATGFAGRHLIDRLDEDGPVAGCYRPGTQPPKTTRSVSWHSVDLTDRAGVAGVIEAVRPSRIFHLAGAPNVADSWSNGVAHLRINAHGTHHLLEAVRRVGQPCRILVVSSGQIYRPSDEPIDEDAPVGPSNPYGFSKLAEDQLALRAAADDGLDVVVARPFNHIGPGQRPDYAVASFARQIARIERGLDAPEIRVGNLDARRDITDVRDVVGAYLRLMASAPSGRAYNICSGRAWRIRDLLDELLRLSPARIEVAVDPARFRPSDVPTVQGDASRIRSELGWVPLIPVEEAIRDTLAWWRSEVAEGRWTYV